MGQLGNIVEKIENTGHQHFFNQNNFPLIFLRRHPQLLQNLNVCGKGLTLSQTSPVFLCVENTVGKGKIARYQQFLLFPQCFLPVWRTLCHFYQIQNRPLQTLFVWKSLKTCHLGKG